MSDSQRRVGIGEASRRTGLTDETLRFYEREGLFHTPVARDAGGRRLYSPDQLGWLEVCVALRRTGMSVERIRALAALVAAGPGNEADRLAVLEAHREGAQAQLRELEISVAVIERKVAAYRAAVDRGTASQLWTSRADAL